MSAKTLSVVLADMSGHKIFVFSSYLGFFANDLKVLRQCHSGDRYSIAGYASTEPKAGQVHAVSSITK